MEFNDVKYFKEGSIAIINFNRSKKYNSFPMKNYAILLKFILKANDDDEILATIITLLGVYFSAGADTNMLSKIGTYGTTEEIDENVTQIFHSINIKLTNAFIQHKKLLVCALNGPVVGLSASIVSLCDLIYAYNDLSKITLLTPFAKLGLISEGALSSSLYHRLGLSKANEALLLGEEISGEDLFNRGFINKVITAESVDEFNRKVIDYIKTSVGKVQPSSLREIKYFISKNWKKDIEEAGSSEAEKGIKQFTKGIAQKSIAQHLKAISKHKL